MSTQELLTFLFNAIALGFIIIASMDFGTRLVTAYKQVSSTSNSPSTSTQKPISKLPLAVKQQELGQLPDPWLLPVQDKGEIVPLTNLAQGEQKHLRLLPPAKTINVFNPELEDLLRGVDLDKLKLRQARKIAKVLGIAQKVNGRDQKLAF
ncbi:hypothetical protein [Chlorogloea sp. CCALA 695]|uniref:hypothetical protein n=1 Tax=Chlorogloea sp. CCALA 695 TaxID=2107693 RepID=UPI000D04FCFF|nr:hypothetical protein [Chlorogloea sp. CCALA 695]PSB25946.1 hypothetical protein C7B70_24460 [Chlorogloea sp. CCALA 695]